MSKSFFQHFLRHPSNVRTMIPLSQSAADQFIKLLKMRSDSTPWRILEVAPGNGSVTKSIVSNMKEHDHLDVIGINPTCCDLLRARYAQDSRVSIHCMSIIDWHPGMHYDLIVSKLPINSFLPSLVAKVLKHYRHLGSQESICAQVEYIGLEKVKFMFAKAETRKVIKERRKILNTFFKHHLLEKKKVFANFLPCYVYHLKLHPTLRPKYASKDQSHCSKVQQD
jgi:phospholipid N-methyltransferase